MIVISLAFIGIITLLGLASALSIAILGENVNDLNVLSQIEVIPIGYFIFILYLILAKGTNGPNKYGENPLELTKSSNV